MSQVVATIKFRLESAESGSVNLTVTDSETLVMDAPGLAILNAREADSLAGILRTAARAMREEGARIKRQG